MQSCAHADGKLLSRQEEGTAAAQVRQKVVDALQRQRSDIEPFLTMPWDVYCKNMATPGTWGGAPPPGAVSACSLATLPALGLTCLRVQAVLADVCAPALSELCAACAPK